MPLSLCTVPVDSDKEQSLPQLQIEGPSWSRWWNMVRESADTRPGLETIVVSAIVISMHDLQCELVMFHSG